MKTLKYTAIALLLFGSLTACVNEELDDDMLTACVNEEMDDDMLLSPDNVEASTSDTGGAIDEL
ncbi:hypothetical protein [Formosa sp. 4Alg 33]|uniref:hypothetical protein n=1 Tax=Formosa sp. 4Alg 33 TaxID=3382189 RepID=UPI003D9C56AB